MWKNVMSIQYWYGAGIRNQDLSNISHLPQPLEQDSRPKLKLESVRHEIIVLSPP